MAKWTDKQRKAIHANKKTLKYADPKKVKEFERQMTIGEQMLDHRDKLKRINVVIPTHERKIQKHKVKLDKLAKEIGLK
jgi:hypothetical protein